MPGGKGQTSKINRKAEETILGVLSLAFPPYGIYRLLHLKAGEIIVMGQNQSVEDLNKDRGGFHAVLLKQHQKSRKDQILAKRVSVLVDGKKIDAMIVGRKNNLKNKRWTLLSNGTNGTYENTLHNNFYKIKRKVAFSYCHLYFI